MEAGTGFYPHGSPLEVSFNLAVTRNIFRLLNQGFDFYHNASVCQTNDAYRSYLIHPNLEGLNQYSNQKTHWFESCRVQEPFGIDGCISDEQHRNVNNCFRFLLCCIQFISSAHVPALRFAVDWWSFPLIARKYDRFLRIWQWQWHPRFEIPSAERCLRVPAFWVCFGFAIPGRMQAAALNRRLEMIRAYHCCNGCFEKDIFYQTGNWFVHQFQPIGYKIQVVGAVTMINPPVWQVTTSYYNLYQSVISADFVRFSEPLKFFGSS